MLIFTVSTSNWLKFEGSLVYFAFVMLKLFTKHGSRLAKKR